MLARLAVWVAGLLVLLLLLERVAPLRSRRATFWVRFGVNLAMAVLAYALSGLVISPLVQRLMHLTGDRPFGLLRWVTLPAAAAIAAAVLAMDLSFYYWH